MIVTYNWLKEFVKFDLPVSDFANKLTSVGPEVVSTKKTGVDQANISLIFPVKVTSIEKHPKADSLRICKVNSSQGNYELVTNSLILEKGDFAVLSLPGARLPNDMEIKETFIKGEKSEGMLLAKEHLNLEEKSQDVWILGCDEKTAKSEFDEYTKEDYIIEIELTSNRSDCLSVIGIAREVAAMLNKELAVPKASVRETTDEMPDVQILEKNLCPRYSARILRDIKVTESPGWIKRRLELCGIRPINNIVDATNYVLLEYGHPMHVFDLSSLDGGQIIVRKAENKEEFKTLDSQPHELNEEMLVICDKNKAVALAGIMGGENSEILDSTVDILLESAYFDPVSIRATSKKLGIKTESSYRFERNADWGVTTGAIERATEIILLTCEPKISKIRDEYVNIFKDKIINVKEDYISLKLGIELSIKEIEAILKRLKFAIVAKREDTIEVKVPTFRSDISKTIDIVEEVARIYGYNSIPQNQFKPPVDVESLRPRKDLKDKLRGLLSGQGFTEAYNFSFTNELEMKKFMVMDNSTLKLQNPLTQDATLMRNYLFFGLLKNIEFNIKNAYRDEARFYEIGRTFIKDSKNYLEKQKLAFVIYGNGYDYYTASGIIEWILKKIGNKPISFAACGLPFLHPVNSAIILYNGKNIGFAGEIFPDISEKLDFKHPAFAAEIEISSLNEILNETFELKTIGKFPPTTRDLSIVVDLSVLARDIMKDIEHFHERISNVEFIDIFKGLQIGANKKSLTYSITFQSMEKTLTDKEVNDIMDLLIEQIKRNFNAELR